MNRGLTSLADPGVRVGGGRGVGGRGGGGDFRGGYSLWTAQTKAKIGINRVP